MNSETVKYEQETVAPAKTFVNRDVSQTRPIAGVSVPDSPLITAAIEHAQRYWSAFVLHHDQDELRRFGFACVPANDVNIIGACAGRLDRDAGERRKRSDGDTRSDLL